MATMDGCPLGAIDDPMSGNPLAPPFRRVVADFPLAIELDRHLPPLADYCAIGSSPSPLRQLFCWAAGSRAYQMAAMPQ